MKTSFVSEMNISHAQPINKPKSFKEGRKSRQNSKQGHMNPLKMKTSFIRQSISLNTSQQNLAINLNNPTVQPSIIPQPVNQPLLSDRREDFMMRKIVQRFSHNASPKHLMYPEQHQPANETQRQRDIIRLSGRKNQPLGMSQIQKSHTQAQQEKQNSQKGVRSFMNHSEAFTKNQPQASTQQKAHRPSHESTVQSVVLDNSLADYAHSLNNSFLQSDQLSLLKEQLQLVLKRLAKNQCDIESLKRDKNVDVHMESVWKQLALCESKFEMIEKRCVKSDERLVKVGQEIHEVREKVISISESQFSLVNHVTNLESKFLSEVSQLDQRITSFINRNEQTQKVNDAVKKIKSEMEGTLQIMNVQFQSRFETKFSQLKWELRSQKSIEVNQSTSSKPVNKFILSSKKAYESIALVYKQLLKVNKPLLSSNQQPNYTNSDRKKLLQSVINQSYTRRTVYSSTPVTPQRTTSQSYFKASEPMVPEIEINQVEYFIDPEGYLLDRSQFYILDDKGEQIRLDQSMIELMKRHDVLKC